MGGSHRSMSVEVHSQVAGHARFGDISKDGPGGRSSALANSSLMDTKSITKILWNSHNKIVL
jgi:hypothetical protein